MRTCPHSISSNLVSLFFFASFHSFSFFHLPIREFRDGDCGHGSGISDGTGQCFPCIISPSAARAERRTLASPLALGFFTSPRSAAPLAGPLPRTSKDIALEEEIMVGLRLEIMGSPLPCDVSSHDKQNGDNHVLNAARRLHRPLNIVCGLPAGYNDSAVKSRAIAIGGVRKTGNQK